MTKTLDSLLGSIIVRVGADGGSGTGFFVSPGRVVTCAHVTGGRPGDAVGVQWQGRIWAGKVLGQHPEGGPPKGGAFPYPDVSLIEVQGVEDHPCAVLDVDPPPVDAKLYTRGFTTTWSPMPTEEPGTFTYEGAHDVDGGFLLKLAAGEAVPGMSGGPLFDLSRSVVCGILKTSRALNTSLGGWGVPLSAVRDLFPEVIDANRRFHLADSRWADLAPRTATDMIVDIGSITEMSPSGKPAMVLFTVTNTAPERRKLLSVRLEPLGAERLPVPHHFLPEGVPDYFDLSAHLTPGMEPVELLELDHVLEPGETEGYRLRLTGDEGWLYRQRLVLAWRTLGDAEPAVWTGEPFALPFRLTSTAGLLEAIRERRQVTADDHD